ncbi:MAG: CCA tRNA nucleotidyltransferase, partial [Planctomycetota bacterium]|nr:CCA tRNA nucleotidyltransferase [Planctomycetota bacterium]
MNQLSKQWNLLAPERREAVLSVARVLEAAGHRAWLVGGAVRDLFLGQDVGDLDMVSAALPDEVVKLFPGAREVGRSFGIVQVLGAGQWIELATFRLERGYSDGRHPDEIRYTDSLEKDAGRRDFTCNAMYWDPIALELADPKGGLADLQQGVLACVGEARGRFEEDGLRLLRMARFLARLDLEPAKGLFEAAAESRSSLRGVSGERILQELRRMSEGPRPVKALEALANSQLLGLALTSGESESLPRQDLRLDLWSDLVGAQRIPRGCELEALLAMLLDPDPDTVLSPAALRSAGKTCSGRLRCSSDLVQQVMDIWRLRSYFSEVPAKGSASIRALREKHGPLAWHIARAWSPVNSAGLRDGEELLAWFQALPQERVWPGFLPTGQKLIEQ